MNVIKNLITNVKFVEYFLLEFDPKNQNNFDSNDYLIEKLNSFGNNTSFTENNLDNIFAQLNSFFNLLIETDEEHISKVYKKFSIDINNENLSVIKELVNKFKNQKNNHNLIKFNWNINIIEKQKNINNSNKIENLEIVFNFTSKTEKEQKNDIMKLNYCEFKEILNNFNKINEQLQMFNK